MKQITYFLIISLLVFANDDKYAPGNEITSIQVTLATSTTISISASISVNSTSTFNGLSWKIGNGTYVPFSSSQATTIKNGGSITITGLNLQTALNHNLSLLATYTVTGGEEDDSDENSVLFYVAGPPSSTVVNPSVSDLNNILLNQVFNFSVQNNNGVVNYQWKYSITGTWSAIVPQTDVLEYSELNGFAKYYGSHTIFFRGQSQSGEWSPENSVSYSIVAQPPTNMTVNANMDLNNEIIRPSDPLVFTITNAFDITHYKWGINIGSEIYWSDDYPINDGLELSEINSIIPLETGTYDIYFLGRNSRAEWMLEANKKTVTFNTFLINSVTSYSLHEPYKADTKTIAQIEALNRKEKSKSKSISDAMGRSLQSIAQEVSQSGNDIVQHVEYDNRGIQSKEFLPYVSDNATGDYKPDADTEQSTYYTGSTYDPNKKLQLTNSPYAETKTEHSPLMRSYEQGSVGDDWQPNATNTSGKTIKSFVRTNTVSDAVRLFDGETGISSTNYVAGQLVVNMTIDEENNESREYKDNSDQVVLKESFNGSATLRTYYVYDDRGNLSYIIPPELAKDIPASGSWNANSHLNTFVTKFSYDSENRLITKQTPEAGEVYTAYDKLGRAVMTQDQNLKLKGQWLFSKYDMHGRVIYTGLVYLGIGSGFERSDIQAALDAETVFWEDKAPSTEIGYTTNLAYPRNITLNNILSITYYDKYIENPVTKDLILPSQVLSQDVRTNRLFGSVVASKIRILEGTDILSSSSWPIADQTINYSAGEQIVLSDPTLLALEILPETIIEVSNGSVVTIEAGLNPSGGSSSGVPKFLASYSLYDKYGRTIQSISDNIMGGKDKSESEYETWSGGKLIKSESYHWKAGGEANPDYVKSRPTYDDLNRVAYTTVERKFNGTVLPTYIPSFTNYNELGEAYETFINPLASKITENTSTGIYSFDSSNENNYLYRVENKKNERGWLTEIDAYKGSTNIFREKLAYQEQNLDNTTNIAMHNGNITAVEIKQNNGSGTDVHYQYNYSYDDINQLTEANYFAHTNAGTNGDYTTNNLTYDLNGNIKTLNRNRVGAMDNLIYNYKNSNRSNKIDRIDDSITDAKNGSYGFKDLIEQANEYEYDVNGNMVKDKNKGIDLIEYNHLNLPSRFVFSSGFEVHYEYDAAGSKVSRKEIVSGGTQTKEYVYSGAFVYESHSAGNPLTLSFMSTGNGRLKVEGSAVHEDYFVKDHLGNTRLTLRSAPAAQTFTYQQQNHYYAFGLTIENLSSPISPESSNRLTYNGKEFDKELNWYHYGARFYDPQVGRWWTVDPADIEYSPYNYVFNNPIRFVDPDGMVPDWYQNDETGNFHWFDGSADIEGYTNFGTSLSFTFNSFIDGDLYDGPLGTLTAGDKLTSSIIINTITNDLGEAISTSITIESNIGATFGLFEGNPNFEGLPNISQVNVKGPLNFSAVFEHHTRVNDFEALGLGLLGYDVVNVAQRAEFNSINGNLTIKALTDIFPSATLHVNGNLLMHYSQPSFFKTHKFTPNIIWGGRGNQPIIDGYQHSRPDPSLYLRY
jgi:RHS repeat-associated protein